MSSSCFLPCSWCLEKICNLSLYIFNDINIIADLVKNEKNIKICNVS